MDALPIVVWRFANAEFEPRSGILRVAGQEQRLRPQTAAVLVQLLERAGNVVSRDALAQSVWAESFVTDNSLAQCISEIRAILGSGSESILETLPRRGYVIQVPVLRDVLGAPPVGVVAVNTRLEATPSFVPAVPSMPVMPVMPAADRWMNIGSRRWVFAGAGAFVVVLCSALWLAVQFGLQRPARLSLAVLPFKSDTAASDSAWFAENVGEDLTTNLSRIPGATVIARVSTQAYLAGATDVRQVGRELGVRYVVAGHVDRTGERVTMNLYLADTENGAVRWTERFETDVNQLRAAERQVADRIANTLHVRIVAAEAQRIDSSHAVFSAADDLALEAWAAWNRGSPADVARAKALAQRALALDDRSVLAWKTIASWHLRARISQTIPTEAAIAGAEAAAQRAMEIDPEHPLVHTVYGAALVLRGRFEEGQKALEHEIATNPSHPVAYYYLGLSHLMMGEPKRAISQYERAIAISPRDPRMSRFQRYLALAYLHDDNMPEALRHARLATQVPQIDRTAWAMLSSVCALAGEQTCSDAATAKLKQLWPGFTIAQGEAEWPPARPEFTARHASYMRGLMLAGLSEPVQLGSGRVPMYFGRPDYFFGPYAGSTNRVAVGPPPMIWTTTPSSLIWEKWLTLAGSV